MRFLFLAFALTVSTQFISCDARALEITGDYTIIGSTTDGTGEYTGALSITRKGEVYQLVWTTGNGKFFGTGLVTKGVLSASWHQGEEYGVSSFIIEEGKLVGTWAYMKSDGKRYKEVATKK